jgi:alkylation response protein AidB-like acyl-CoA dehydrogenase
LREEGGEQFDDMIDFDLTEEQRTLREVARSFLQKECPMSLVRKTIGSNDGFSRELWSKIAEAGWLGLVIPSNFSGAGMSPVELAIILDEEERVAFQGPFIETAALAPTLILHAGTEEQKTDFSQKSRGGKLSLARASKSISLLEK